MADLGTDISCVDDVDQNLTAVSGRTGLLQALARRLMTPLGGLWYDPEYGFDVRQFLNGPVRNTSDIEAGVQAECLKDERVHAVACVASFVNGTLRIGVTGEESDGPFSLTVSATALTVTLLAPDNP